MRTMQELVRDFNRIRQEYEKFEKQIPRLIGVVAKKNTLNNFKQQGFEGNKWRKRSNVTDNIYDNSKQYRGSVYSSSNPILRQTGNLYDSIIYKADAKGVRVGANKSLAPYAKLMNEGGTKQFKAGLFKKVWRKIPKRQFLGVTKKMIQEIEKEIFNRRQQIFKKKSFTPVP